MREFSKLGNSATSSIPSSRRRRCRNVRPRRSANCCNGTRLAWCSISVTTIHRRLGNSHRPSAGRQLIDSVVPRREDDFFRPRAWIKPLHLAASLLHRVGAQRAKRVGPAMHVRVILFVAVGHRLNDLARALASSHRCRSRSTARLGDRERARHAPLAQDRKIRAELIRIERQLRRGGHACSLLLRRSDPTAV